jgi:sodium-dependent dicarboxylate transporter 2/3/5
MGVWMAVWWMTEAIPVYATALLPLALFPLTGIASISEAASPYGNDVIYLFLGGFVLALSMERWGLHKRIALFALRYAGTGAAAIVGGFMAVTAFLSMWVSNTATAIIMLPIATSIFAAAGIESDSADENHRHFARALMLGIAYAASIGGIGTLIGTPPNLFLASFAQSQLGITIGFAQWLGVGVPLVLVFLPLAWLLLTRVLYPVHQYNLPIGATFAETAYTELGRTNVGERVTLAVFLFTAAAWIFRPLLVKFAPLAGLTDTSIAILAALLLFALPVDPRRHIFVMNWETAVKLPWGVLLLFGGGLSLASAVRANGVAELIGAQVHGLVGMPEIVILLAVVTTIVFLTELTSNTATTAALLPVLAAIAPALSVSPLLLIVPAAIAASCAFMLPVATPPNAVVFGTGYVTTKEMAHAGFWLNWVSVALIALAAYFLVPIVLG